MNNILLKLSQSAWTLKYTDCISAEVKTPTTIMPDMTQNTLMVRLQ